MKTARELIQEHAELGAELRRVYFKEHGTDVENVGLCMARALARGNTILACGNGGSAADCQHFTGELVGRFTYDRPSLPGIALTVDSSGMTAIANDYGYENIFARQVRGLGRSGDVLLGISTSGNSPSVLNALEAAREKGMVTVGLCGNGGGHMPPYCDYLLDVAGASTPLVQEVHAAIVHLMCRVIDYYLFENAQALGDLSKKPGLEGA